MVLKNNHTRFAVIGAGNGGQAMAGHLALMGLEVCLYNRNVDKIRDIKISGGILLEGIEEGFGHISIITGDIEEAISGADVVMVTVPASAHRDIAKLCLPYLKDGQVIILNPGRTGGALEFLNIIKSGGCDIDIIIAEAQTFVYACRVTAPGKVKIFSVKNEVSLAAVPADMTQYVIGLLSDVYPQFVPAENVLETSLNNVGAVFHPAPTLLNCGRIEYTHGGFEYYIQGITPSVAEVLEHIDSERVRVARALGVRAVTALEWLRVSYGSWGDCLYEAIQNTTGYRGINAPVSMETRYIFEDVPESLVPISAIGSIIGVRTPTIDSIIQLASIIHDRNYYSQGRNMKNMGIEGLTVSQITELATYGEVSRPEEVVA